MRTKVISHLIHSNAINARRVFRLLLPDVMPAERLPLLVLLHGVHGSEIDWTEQGNLQQTVELLMREGKLAPMAILMPSDGLTAIGTGYLNWNEESAHRYEDYLLQDLIPHVERAWNVGGSREKRAISGLSMGGYAAIRLAFAQPNYFGAASSLSGFFDVQELGELIGQTDYKAIFNEDQSRILEFSPLDMNLPSFAEISLMLTGRFMTVPKIFTLPT